MTMDATPGGEVRLAKQNPAYKATKAPLEGKVYFRYADIHATITSLIPQIREFDPSVIIAIGGGGFIPARMLRTELKIPILAVNLELYDESTGSPQLLKKIQWFDEQSEVGSKVHNQKVLIVDEVDDTRSTLQYCVEEVIKTHQPSGVAVAVVHNKIKPKKGVLPEDTIYMAGSHVEDYWNCYPWDAAAYGNTIYEHEALASKCSSTTTPNKVAKLPTKTPIDGKIYFSYAEIHDTISSLVPKIREFNPSVIIAIGGGGFIPARMLWADIKVPLLAISLELYGESTTTIRKTVQKLQWFDENSEVGSKVRGHKVLIVDEVDDTGATLQYCVEEVIKTNEPSEIAVAVVHNKIKPKKGKVPDHVVYMAGDNVEDYWNCYPWETESYGNTIYEHEALAEKCSTQATVAEDSP